MVLPSGMSTNISSPAKRCAWCMTGGKRRHGWCGSKSGGLGLQPGFGPTDPPRYSRSPGTGPAGGRHWVVVARAAGFPLAPLKFECDRRCGCSNFIEANKRHKLVISAVIATRGATASVLRLRGSRIYLHASAEWTVPTWPGWMAADCIGA
jgi:hypothetical protein